jgi:hypothetical membrane protein
MSENKTTQICVAVATCLPIVYFAAQLAAAPFYPQYSFNRQVASMLGSRISTQPWIFNTGMLLSGIVAMVGSYGLFRAFRQRAGLVWSLLVGIGVLATGVTTFKGGLYPLPDPRHTSWGFLTVFIIAIPLLLLIAAWRARLPASLRYYLIFSVALVLVLFPFMSGIISVSHPGNGTFQRLFAIATFIPVGMTAYALRTRQRASGNPGQK